MISTSEESVRKSGQAIEARYRIYISQIHAFRLILYFTKMPSHKSKRVHHSAMILPIGFTVLRDIFINVR